MLHKGADTLETERLILRKYKPRDAKELFDAGALGTSLADAEALVAAATEQNGQISNYNWVIEFEGRAAGRIKVVECSTRDSFMQIGYSVGTPYQHLGLMAEALSAVLRFLLLEVGAHRVYGQARVSNAASLRVMQKAGMVFEGRQRKHFLEPDGSYVDVDIYGILREDLA